MDEQAQDGPGRQVTLQIASRAWRQTLDQVKIQTWDWTRCPLTQPLDQVRDQIHIPIGNQVWSQVRERPRWTSTERVGQRSSLVPSREPSMEMGPSGASASGRTDAGPSRRESGPRLGPSAGGGQ